MTAARTWPVMSTDAAYHRLTAPGAPFEMRDVEVRGRRVRSYVAAVDNMAALLSDSRHFGDRPLLIYEGERLSFDHHWRATTTLGHILRGPLKVKPGDRVAVAMRNYPEWSVCAWAILAAGAVLVPLNAWEPGSALAGMLEDSGAKIVFADAERAERLAREVVEAAIITARVDDAALSLERLIGPLGAYGALDPAQLPSDGIDPDDDATIFYTSGTTGWPKGAVGSHRNIATNLVNVGFRSAWTAVRRGEDIPQPTGAARRQLLPLPFFHVTGFQSSLAPALANGTTLVLMRKWDVERALELIETERVNGLTLVPSQALQLVEAAARSSRDLSSVDTLSYGGASSPARLAGEARTVFRTAWPGQGYGATETSSLAAANAAEDMLARPDSAGVACPSCDLKVSDEAGAAVAPGAVGEIWVRGPNVVRGYWNQSEATASAFQEGWYRTGDIGQIDSEGFLKLLDRAKDMLIRGGENIYCVEIENVLSGHPAVAETAVIGAPHPVLGEVVAAVVRPKPGHEVTGPDLIAHASTLLAAHKVPVAIQLREVALPRNAAGKVLKRELRAAFLAEAWPVRSP